MVRWWAIGLPCGAVAWAGAHMELSFRFAAALLDAAMASSRSERLSKPKLMQSSLAASVKVSSSGRPSVARARSILTTPVISAGGSAVVNANGFFAAG